MEIFSERLALLLRENEKMRGKQNDLAKAIGVSRQTIYAYMKNTTPPADTIIRIADYFDVSVDYLLGHERKPSDREQGLSAAAYTNLSETAVAQLRYFAEKDIDARIFSTLLEEEYIQDFVLAIKNSLISANKFHFPNEPENIQKQMNAIADRHFQDRVDRLFKQAQEKVGEVFAKELKKEIAQDKSDIIDAALKARAWLDMLIMEANT